MVLQEQGLQDLSRPVIAVLLVRLTKAFHVHIRTEAAVIICTTAAYANASKGDLFEITFRHIPINSGERGHVVGTDALTGSAKGWYFCIRGDMCGRWRYLES